MTHRIFQCQPLGIIHTAFKRSEGTPIQPSRAKGTRGMVEVYEPFWAGLADLDGFERIWLIYWLDRAIPSRLMVKPYLDSEQRGVFATRAPSRPNPIGISAVRLLAIERGSLTVEEIDVLDGTPLLDIKPYISEWDAYPGSRAGWFDRAKTDRCIADDRFETPYGSD
jgi:tRNA-Thr(GGU) m(6)t(6)A37 methyltransferase TsaA